MPLMRGHKRRAEAEEEANEDASPISSPEPATQRRRITPPDEDEDAYASDNATTRTSDSSLDTLVKKMVRLALACEYQRRPIRRADISEKVLGAGGGGAKLFKTVFQQAQMQLRVVFGMEMVELPGRERVTVAQKRAAAKSQSQQSKTATSWILVSILPSAFRDPQILHPVAAPTAAEDSKYTSIYTLLISLISLSGGQLPSAKMDRYLRRLNMEDATPVDGCEKTEKLLKRLERDGYVLKVKESTGTGEEDVFWIVGPRGKVEVGDGGVRGLTEGVYGELEEVEAEELERKIGRSLGSAEKAAVVANGVEKKKRGRPRKDEVPEEEEEESERESDEG